MMLVFLFWLLSALVVYVYVGYPLLLYVIARSRSEKIPAEPVDLPSVSLLISAYNEEACIAEKLRNSLSLNYPPGKLEIIVISDASSDATDAIVGEFDDEGVRLLRMQDRSGKTLGLNAAVEQASGDIVVFSDANAIYDSDAINALARRFVDPGIGAVIGEQKYVDGDSESGKNESLYWRYETAIKELESAWGSVVGGDGAIYAVRSDLYEPMAADALSDFINPLQVVRAGHRCVYDRSAVAFEETAEEFGKEFRRKVRIVNRAWRAVMSMPEMLNPFRFGAFSIKLWSHKVLRWLVPFFLLALLPLNIALLDEGQLYALALAVQALFYLLAFVGRFLSSSSALPAILSVPYYFCLVNIASAKGIIENYSGRTYTTWSTPRDKSESQ